MMSLRGQSTNSTYARIPVKQYKLLKLTSILSVQMRDISTYKQTEYLNKSKLGNRNSR